MTDNQGKAIQLDVLGKTIAGIVCDRYLLLDEAVLLLDSKGNCKAIKTSSLSGEVEVYSINGDEIEEVLVTNSETMFLFYTKSKQYLVNEQNQIVEDSDQWVDSFFEVLSSSFYRQDAQGFWYDIEGFRMHEKVFVKDDVLISLDTKKSKQSLSFKDQDLFISEHKQLIQIGKLVLNLNLEVVKFFGEKVTALGKVNVVFEGKDVLQEVKLGLNNTAFINEFTQVPYMFGDKKITQHSGTFQYGKKRVEVFQTAKKSYAVEGSSSHFLSYKDKPLQIETQKHVSFKDSELVKVSDGKKSFYFDLNKNEAFNLPSLDDKNLSEIDAVPIRIGKERIFNVATPIKQFAIQESDGSVFKLDDGSIIPERVEDTEELQKYYGFAIVDGHRKLFSKKFMKILKFGRDSLEVSEIIYHSADKLINAIDTNGNKLVLDLRHGFEEVCMAEAEGEKISEVYGTTMPIGNKMLMNVFIETLGGSNRRVIDTNQTLLSFFTLPIELKEISDRNTPSVFAGNYLSEINYFDELVIEGKTFIAGEFMAFTGKEFPVILEKESGRPIHLQGIGHRNELASTWEEYTIQKQYYLGDHRMMGVKTISEDQKENNLLFSVSKQTSWLPFYENYLPIFKHVMDLEGKDKDHSDYHLFELREVSKEKEFLAVEKIPPYRILVDQKSGEYRPRIVKTKKK